MERERGTPQGSAVSPVLANLFMHYAFDAWLAREYPGVWFERYADDAVVHCVTERQAREVLAVIADRMVEVGLRLHPDKTRIVYCKDAQRRGEFEHTAFTFLGFTFRARKARGKDGSGYTAFLPAISKDALSKISAEVRSWRLHTRTTLTFAELARRINPIVRGWMQYYGALYRGALRPLLESINAYLMRWIRKKYRRLRGFKKAVNGHLDLGLGGQVTSRLADSRSRGGCPPVLPVGGRGVPGVGQFKGTTPLPARAWARRWDSPSVWTKWAWCMSRSTEAVARVLGMIVSKPDGWILLVTAIERRSYAASMTR